MVIQLGRRTSQIAQMILTLHFRERPQFISVLCKEQPSNDGCLSFNIRLPWLPVYSCCGCFLRVPLRLVSIVFDTDNNMDDAND